jgi:hypothetical protein
MPRFKVLGSDYNEKFYVVDTLMDNRCVTLGSAYHSENYRYAKPFDIPADAQIFADAINRTIDPAPQRTTK